MYKAKWDSNSRQIFVKDMNDKFIKKSLDKRAVGE